MKEADLYPALKQYLQAQGYTVKAEIGSCDIMAIRQDEPPILIEMKTSFTLTLVLQGTARQSLFDDVYLAVPAPRKAWPARYKDIVSLCRRLGLGLLVVGKTVEAHLDPAPYHPRKSTARAGKLLREFTRRVGDPNIAGTTGVKRMTAYRQDALRCLWALGDGPKPGREVARLSGVAKATALMRSDHYGWFERPDKGIYARSPKGTAALIAETDALALLGLGQGDHGH